jgi:probable HAF family extracellular repeat protein
MLSCARINCLSIVLVLAASGVQAQTQASCSFKLFPLMLDLPICSQLGAAPGCTTWIYPYAVNDWGTIVGLAQVPSAEQNVAFIQWAGGGVSFPFGLHTVSVLSGRSNKGTSIGYSGTGPNPVILPGFGTSILMGAPVSLNGTTSKPIQFFVPTGQLNVNGINKWGSIVGAGEIGGDLAFNGFKRWSNGSILMLNYPGAARTVPTSINDDGAVVGYYTDAAGQSHGFLYLKGKWATIDYPKATQTLLSGISNAGMIVGNATLNGAQTSPATGQPITTAFLYKNGTFESIAVPNNPSDSVYVAVGISPRQGLILLTNWPVYQGFTATCQ